MQSSGSQGSQGSVAADATAARSGVVGWVLAGALVAVVCPSVSRAEPDNRSLFGAALRSRPDYDGAAGRQVDVIPVVRYLGSPWFLRSTQGLLEGGLRVPLGSGLHVGAQIAYEPGRLSSESEFLRRHPLGDVDRGFSAGLQIEWDRQLGPMPVNVLARLRRHTDAALGSQADLRLTAGVFERGRFGAGVFAQTTWADSKSAAAHYGITPAQSTRSGLSAHAAGSGLIAASAGLLYGYDFGSAWSLVGSFEARRLTGDAASSPLTDRKSNYSLAAGLAYRF